MLMRIMYAGKKCGIFPEGGAIPLKPEKCSISGILLLILAIFLASPVHHVLGKWDAGSMASIHGGDHGTHQSQEPSSHGEEAESSCMQQDGMIVASLALPSFATIDSIFSDLLLYAHHYSMPDLKPPSVSMV